MSTAIAQILKQTDHKTINLNNNPISVSINNINLNNTNTKTLKLSVTDVRSRATDISEKLNNPSRFLFYCKVVWHLSEARINQFLEQSLNCKNGSSERYFSWLCSKAMRGEI